MTDPSVLDFLTAKLRFWRPSPAGMPTLRQLWRDEAPAAVDELEPATVREDQSSGHEETIELDRSEASQPSSRLPSPQRRRGPAPLAVASTTGLALVALLMLQQPHGAAVALTLLVGAVGTAGFAVRRREVTLADEAQAVPADRVRLRLLPAALAVVACTIVAVDAADNVVAQATVIAWAAGLLLAALAVLGPPDVRSWRHQLALNTGSRTLGLPRTALLPVLVFAAAVGIRSWHLDAVPAEMLSVHAELIQAIVTAGQPASPVIFPWGQGGLEPIPVYGNAWLALLAGGLGFASLKLGTLLAGLATLPIVLLLGREIGGRAAGIAAMALAAVASWPDLVSRTGLAEGWYPPLAGAAVLLLIRGARRPRPRTFVAAGVVIGIAVQTDSIGRSLVVAAPLLLAAAWIVAGSSRRRAIAVGLALVLTFAAVAGLPTFAAARPAPGAVDPSWWFGAAEGTRDHGALDGLGNRALQVLMMPIRSDGPAWDHGGRERPALDPAAAAILVLGTCCLVVGTVVRRRAAPLLILLAIPLTMLPAVLTPIDPLLAPSPVRCGGAVGPIFAVAGYGLALLFRAVAGWLESTAGRVVAAAVVTAVVAASAVSGHAVVHTTFAKRWDAGTWNASELGAVVRAAMALGVAPEHTRVVPFPHWVDTRLVAVEAGLPGADLAIDPDTLESAVRRPGPQLYLVHPNDHESLRLLREALPNAMVVKHPSRVPGKPFMSVTNITAETS